ncbi:hypothetical protein [Chitinophaga sp. HK235]|uniref:hypothetical protein n=1 Tax=Chitinophaga sp. HK235 TaxID=2952571 RepID=UPI001BAAE775|nr:hypothetical protein [Chitinophaga sp. HK235]
MKTFLFKIILFFLGCYWIITLFFIFPPNPLNISLDNMNNQFQSVFFQRWAFFAPPPKYNSRIYIVFIEKATSNKSVFEVLEPILRKKHNNAPFNTSAQIMDYIFASSLIGIDDKLKTMQDAYKGKEFQTRHNLSDSLITDRIITQIENSTDFITLRNYALKIASEQNINIEKTSYQIQITRINLAQFVDRMSAKREEKVIFSSHIFSK